MSGVLFGIVWGGLGEVRLGALWAGMVVLFEGRVGGVRPFFPKNFRSRVPKEFRRERAQ